MNFVNKKDFEAAVALINRAVKNNQVLDGCNDTEMDSFGFGYQNGSNLEYFKTADGIRFLPPDMAAKNHLHSIREKIKIAKKHSGETQKALDKLEADEKALATLLPTLKE